MEPVEIAIYSVALVLNVLFSRLGARWIASKGYPELKWLMFGLGLAIGFVMQLLVISFMPGKHRGAPRRSLQRAMPTIRMPRRRETPITR